jgi:predicted O-methyltransferase YrrM
MKDFDHSLITKYTNLVDNDSLSSYKNHACQQNHNSYQYFFQLLKEKEPKRILEIGTALGGFTAFLLDITQNLQLECLIRSYDIHYNSWYEDLKKDGVDIRIENIFGDMYDSVPDEVVSYIKSDGLTLVLCDGGSKNNEFRLLSEYLKPNDIIMAHDYAPNSEYFEQYMRNKIWNLHEIQDSDIIESCQLYVLQPYMREEFLNVAWACFRKIGESHDV